MGGCLEALSKLQEDVSIATLGPASCQPRHSGGSLTANKSKANCTVCPRPNEGKGKQRRFIYWFFFLFIISNMIKRHVVF